MIDFLVPLAISNALVAGLIAVIAWAVHRTHRYPAVAHVLWVLVLVKLLSPPLFTIPAIPVPSAGPPDAAAVDAAAVPAAAPRATSDTAAARATIASLADPSAAEPHPLVEAAASASAPPPATTLGGDQSHPHIAPPPGPAPWALYLQRWGVGIWLVGSIIALVCSARRILRFHRALQGSAIAADGRIQAIADALAPVFELRSAPRVRLSSARIAPLLWWVGGRPSILLPADLVSTLSGDELRLIIAHELAHLKRRDHMVRWIEWLVGITFWWNPLTWWARRNLRASEEICCDALVVRTLSPQPRCYAASLLHVIEHLTSPLPALRTPAVVSAMNGSGGGTLERRFRMIMSNTPTHRPSRLMSHGLLVLMFACLPLGLAYGQNYKAVERKLGEAVAEGDLSLEQAMIMMKALKESAAKDAASSDGSNRSAFERAERDHRAAHAAGLISDQELELQLDALKRKQKAAEDEERAKAAAQNKSADDETRRRYEQVEAEMRKLVESGRMSEADMNARLEARSQAMKAEAAARMMAEQASAEAERAASQMLEARRAVDELKELGEAGQISQEEMDARIRAMRLRMSNARGDQRSAPAGGGGAQADLRRAVAERVREIDRLQREGELSPEDAKARKDALYERARRAAADQQSNEQGAANDINPAVVNALLGAGIPREHIRPALGAIERVIVEHHEEGSAFELNPDVRTHLQNRLQMNEAQIDLVVGIARRLGNQRVEAAGGISPQKFEEATREIRSMVQAGSLSREDAGVKMWELRRALDAGNRAILHGERARPASNPDRPAARARSAEAGNADEGDALRRRIGAAVERGDLTREEAARILRENGLIDG